MTNPYLGEIRLFPYNFAPKNWFECAGQILPLSQYTALFSLLGTYYGGNGSTTFGLPDLRGRTPVHTGGALQYPIGAPAGTETVTLNSGEMPAHTHQMKASTGNGSPAPNNNSYGHTGTNATGARYAPDSGALLPLNPLTISPTGNTLPHENMQPFLTLNYCICYQGAFPARN